MSSLVCCKHEGIPLLACRRHRGNQSCLVQGSSAGGDLPCLENYNFVISLYVSFPLHQNVFGLFFFFLMLYWACWCTWGMDELCFLLFFQICHLWAQIFYVVFVLFFFCWFLFWPSLILSLLLCLKESFCVNCSTCIQSTWACAVVRT